MGLEVTTSCSCGNAQAKIAIGPSTRSSGCSFPCLCEACQRLVQVDLADEPPRCPECHSNSVVPYDDPKLVGSGGDVVVHCSTGDQLGRVLELTDGTYYCPSCGQMSLRFTTGWRFPSAAST
ncbi:MAG: hypothetical protein GX537_09085 [Actinobacteria bacterium]|nr:hypothetical protein [Actinomycetota bacterium]